MAAKKNPQDKLFEPDRIQVLFRDELRIRLRDGGRSKTKKAFVPTALRSKGLGGQKSRAMLRELAGGEWHRLHSVSEKKIDELVKAASKTTKERLPDLNNHHVLVLPPGLKPRAACSMLAELDEVAHARLIPRPVPPAQSPFDFSDPANISGFFQGHLAAPGTTGVTEGIDAFYAWTRPGGAGNDVGICNVEYNWNFNHDDLVGNGGLTLLGPPTDPILASFDDHHGTAMIAVAAAAHIGNGVAGVAHEADKFAASVSTSLIAPFNPAAAIAQAAVGTDRGDVILIGVGTPGPNASFPYGVADVGSQLGVVPAEWEPAVFAAISLATAIGRIVVEVAGNGSENLDAAVYREDDWQPFVPGNDSGAIIVGGGFTSSHRRFAFSNFGSRVNVQGWGASVVTAAGTTGVTGGFLHFGDNARYATAFNGTSSASAMLAGASASLQGMFRIRLGRSAVAEEIRELLLATNTVQPADDAATGRIGPLPNLRMASDAIERLRPRATIIAPPPGQAYPAPLEVTAGPLQYDGNPDSADFAIWYSTNPQRPPNEGTSGSRELCRGNACFTNANTVELAGSGLGVVAVRAFADDPRTGARIAGDADFALYQTYTPSAGPQNLRASQGGDIELVRVNWNTLNGAIDYEVWTGLNGPTIRLENSGLATPVFVHSGAPANSDPIPYWVRARVGLGTGDVLDRFTEFSGPVSGWRSLPPHQPTLEVDATEKVIRVDWPRPTWGTGFARYSYQLRRASGSKVADAMAAGLGKVVFASTPGTVIGPVGPLPVAATSEFTDDDIDFESVYVYWLLVTDDDGHGPTPTTAPAIYKTGPIVVASMNGFRSRVRLDWTAVEAAIGYEVFRGGGDDPIPLTEGRIAETRFDDEDAPEDGSARTYRVRAVLDPDVIGFKFAYSQMSVPVLGWRLAPPVNVTDSRPDDSTIHLEWTPAPWAHAAGEVEYDVFRKVSTTAEEASNVAYDPAGEVRIATTTALSYDDTALTPGRVNVYWVFAREVGGHRQTARSFLTSEYVPTS